MREIFMFLTPSTINIQSDPPSTELSEVLTENQAPSKHKKDYSAVISWILRGGATLSAAIMLIGMLLLLLHPGGLSGTSLQVFPHTVDQVWIGLLALQPQAVIAAGALLLLATPVMTVTAAAVTFAYERDRRYVVITLLVLAILITSFLIGKGG
jgi:uncharacterized membrane protein